MLFKDKLNKIILLTGDVIILYISLFLTLTIRYQSLPAGIVWEIHKFPFFILFIIWVLIFYIAGLYDLGKFISPKELQGYIIRTVTLAGIIAILMFYLVPSFIIAPKTNLLLDLIITLGLLLSWRRFFTNKLLRAKKIKVLFFGFSKDISEFTSYLNQNLQLGYKVAVIMKPEGEIWSPDLQVNLESRSPSNHNMVNIIKEKNISLIITSRDIKENKELVRMFYDILSLGVSIVDFPRFYEGITGKIPVSLINESWFLENLVEINNNIFETVKRWLDIFFAVILGIFTIMITPFIALVIKIESRGSVFYHQKRTGRNGEVFEIIKFRSMKENAENNGAVWAQKNDMRVTRIGNILRKTRIDELPQLWNVLKGDLSFIGPRPERPEFVKQLKKEVPHYAMRHLIKPGLSGWAQINFPYGASVEDAMEKLQYDLFYIKNRSLTLDLSIYLKTLATIVRYQGR